VYLLKIAEFKLYHTGYRALTIIECTLFILPYFLKVINNKPWL